MTTPTTATPIADAWRFVAEVVEASGDLTPGSAKRFTEQWLRFELFARRAHGAVMLDDVDAAVVAAFVEARVTGGGLPAPSTARTRLAAIRYPFKALRLFGVIGFDPTLDIKVAASAAAVTRALTDAEVDRCRFASQQTVVATRYPVVWALAEAGAATGEIGWAKRSDIDVDRGAVWVGGGAKASARWLPLTSWGATVVRRFAVHVNDPSEWMAVERAGDHDSRRTSVTAVLTETLDRAGLRGLAGVEPRSITAWAGHRLLDETGRIDEVARILGLSSLDAAADLVGLDWRRSAAP
jgi:integrase/recombinase XerC